MPVVIDTDGGVDDAAALWWALTDPAIDVAAITTVAGNVSVDAATALVQRVLHAAGRTDITVAKGFDRPARGGDLHGLRVEQPTDPVHDLSAPEFLAALPDGTDLIALGPLSNIAGAMTLDATLPDRLGKVVLMGGPWERDEFNFTHDRIATLTVLSAHWPEPPLVLGLDDTEEATLTDAEFDLLAQLRTPAAGFLHEPLRTYRAAHGGGDCPVHDLLAVLAYVDPEVDVTGFRDAARQLFT